MKYSDFLKKNIYIFFLFFFLIFLLIFELIFSKYKYTHTFLIKPNQTLNDISGNLYKERIIDNKFFFKFMIHLNLAEKKLKAGEYEFSNNNILQIISKIKRGESYQRKLIIPEGLTSYEILEIIKKTDGIIINNNDLNKKIKEGELFPSTYFYVYGTNFNIIINNMKKRMNSILNNAWQNRDKDLPLKSYNDALILASLIEKEASLNYEKSLVAEVFLNRLKLNMKLQSDPTVLYGIEQQSGLKKKELKKKDLKHESKFNTYLNHGLPIGPICNPGKDSIIAATNPSKGDLLYFVANGDGGHNFSTNYKSHLKNVEKFKKFVNENKK